MKKFIIMLLCLSAWSVNSACAEAVIIDLNVDVEYVDETPVYPGHNKAPIRMPRIYQDGYKFTLSSYHPEYIINILHDDELVYSSVILAGITEFELPSYLSGECIIQFVKGRFCFWGYISL